MVRAGKDRFSFSRTDTPFLAYYQGDMEGFVIPHVFSHQSLGTHHVAMVSG